MPYKIEKVKGGFRVVNAETGKVHAKRTTKENAKQQVAVLNMRKHGVPPKGKRST